MGPKGGTSSGAWAGEGKEGEGKEGVGGPRGPKGWGPTWVPTWVQTPPPQMDLIAIPRVLTRPL